MLNMKQMVKNNQKFFICLYPKVANYSRQKLLDVNRNKILAVPDNFLPFSFQDYGCYKLGQGFFNVPRLFFF